jgi:hypothetical protein
MSRIKLNYCVFLQTYSHYYLKRLRNVLFGPSLLICFHERYNESSTMTMTLTNQHQLCAKLKLLTTRNKHNSLQISSLRDSIYTRVIFTNNKKELVLLAIPHIVKKPYLYENMKTYQSESDLDSEEDAAECDLEPRSSSSTLFA